MSEIPAFPVHPNVRDDEPHAGMTLRDYIATAALQGIGTWVPMEPKAPYMHQVDLKGDDALKARAEWSYRQADFMLKARAV